MKEKVRLAMIGTSGRGMSQLRELLAMPEVEIPAVCDLYEDRVENAKDLVSKNRPYTPNGYTDYQELLKKEELDAVVICTSWTSHIKISLAAMKAGCYVATEVGGAVTLDECFELVRVSEETGMPLMMLENCCYGREELALLKMVKQGFFGELVHMRGGYEHDLRDEVNMGKENRHYRLNNYKNRNGDIYPTHALGPLCKMLDINRGNRLVSLTSMASKSRGLNVWAKEHRGEDDELATFPFALGDVVMTMIKCANGETILLTHGTSLPRPYSRDLRVQGTKAIYEEGLGLFCEEVAKKNLEASGADATKIFAYGPFEKWEDFEAYMSKYEHPIWKNYDAAAHQGHGGMDYLVLSAFVDSVKRGVQTPIDVYDTVTWMAVTPLSEASIACGGAPMAFPDFTKGAWIDPRPDYEGFYSLSKDNL